MVQTFGGDSDKIQLPLDSMYASENRINVFCFVCEDGSLDWIKVEKKEDGTYTTLFLDPPDRLNLPDFLEPRGLGNT
jgi:hypothetical protein